MFLWSILPSQVIMGNVLKLCRTPGYEFSSQAFELTRFFNMSMVLNVVIYRIVAICIPDEIS